MAIYQIECPNCGPQEIVAKMSDGAAFMPCPSCERARPQIFSAPYFTEDRLRMWKGPMGNKWSHALGAPMPETRAERDRMAARKGVEFTSLKELRRDSKEADEALTYRAHVDAGGSRVDSAPAGPAPEWKSAPPPGVKV